MDDCRSVPGAVEGRGGRSPHPEEAGLAFGAFHRWIYTPLKAGELSHPLSHKLTVVKAALAGGFTYHELKLALRAAQADPTLSKLTGPIAALQNKLSGVASGLQRPVMPNE